MTEHDNKENKPVSERERDRETRGEKSFLLFVAILLALTLFILLIVSSSLSIIISTGTVTPSDVTLTVVKFNAENITVAEVDPQNEPMDDRQIVLYAFEITNNNDVDITYDMEFSITLTITRSQNPDLENLKYVLVDEAYLEEYLVNGDSGNCINFSENGTNESMTIEGSTDPDADFPENDWLAFYLRKGESATVLLIADCRDMNGEMVIEISGTIVITKIHQAEGTE